MDERKWSRIRAIPLRTLVARERIAYEYMSRLGGTRDSTTFVVGDIIDAIEAGRGFTPHELYGGGHVLKGFWEGLKAEDMTYLDWKHMPPETATTLLPYLPKPRVLACDVRVLGMLSSAEVACMAMGLNRPMCGKIVLPDAVTVADIVTNPLFFTVTHQRKTAPASYTNARALLSDLGFKPKDGYLLKCA